MKHCVKIICFWKFKPNLVWQNITVFYELYRILDYVWLYISRKIYIKAIYCLIFVDFCSPWNFFILTALFNSETPSLTGAFRRERVLPDVLSGVATLDAPFRRNPSYRGGTLLALRQTSLLPQRRASREVLYSHACSRCQNRVSFGSLLSTSHIFFCSRFLFIVLRAFCFFVILLICSPAFLFVRLWIRFSSFAYTHQYAYKRKAGRARFDSYFDFGLSELLLSNDLCFLLCWIRWFIRISIRCRSRCLQNYAALHTRVTLVSL